MGKKAGQPAGAKFSIFPFFAVFCNCIMVFLLFKTVNFFNLPRFPPFLLMPHAFCLVLTKTANTLGTSSKNGSKQELLDPGPRLSPSPCTLSLKGCRHLYNGPHALGALSVIWTIHLHPFPQTPNPIALSLFVQRSIALRALSVT